MEQKDIDRIIEMAKEDRTPFKPIKIQFSFSEAYCAIGVFISIMATKNYGAAEMNPDVCLVFKL